MKHFDHIIVGQGLAGSVLALQLEGANKKVLVIDNPSLPSSSKVAAGIWNPIVFKRFTKSWEVDALLPEMFSFYFRMEKKWKIRFLHLRNIAKQFNEEQEKMLWVKKARQEMHAYMDEAIYPDHELTQNDFSLVLNSGNIDVNKFLEATRSEFQNKKSLLPEKFDHALLELNAAGVKYKDYTASSVIFCEGSAVSANPFFNRIPCKPAKGEVLTIRCQGLNLQQIVNKGIFILPLGDNLFKVGATFEWADLSDDPTEKAKQELVEKLDKLLKLPYSIVAHESGIRPSSVDRRPVIGDHPQYPQLKIFNGMGTKAVMLAPYFAQHFIDFMEGRAPLNPEVSTARFKE